MPQLGDKGPCRAFQGLLTILAESRARGNRFPGRSLEGWGDSPVYSQVATASHFPLIRAALCPAATASPTSRPWGQDWSTVGGEVQLPG